MDFSTAPPMTVSLLFGVISCLLALAVGHPFIWLLRLYGVGKAIQVELPASHGVKAGTPTMGGLLICGTVVVVTAILVSTVHVSAGRSILLPIGVLIGSAILGAIDDRLSLLGRAEGGLSERSKLAWSLSIGVASAIVLWHPGLLGVDYLFVPTVREAIHLSSWLYLPLAVVAIVGSSHAVNLTDGLDSLAGWTAFVAFATFGFIAYVYEQYYLVTFCFTVAGAVAAFLWFNAYPALVFMGDTGALALGATLAVVALMLGQVLLLPLVGIVFVAEAGSVILQRGYFKATHGKRLFRMAPIHLHFQLMGWSETQVAQRFWLVSILAAMLGIALALV
jgi:phospho-N-acetylmuramoyl-pentapeptide-transferase